ncbi:MAG: hypothetical protein JRJ21_08760 [Deltaproteobacteria bacterium]|nr:hypothetical protein [Deltaproteobacteria bacterium]
MKKLTIIIVFACFCMVSTAPLGAEDFLGAPVIPQGEETIRTDARLELKTRLSHDQVVLFYREALKGFQDIKFREWEDSTYIEDDGKLKWHSITISKGDEKGTTVTIVKDNWTWIIGTLVLRYIGVFAVLMILFIGMSVSGKIISGIVKKKEAGKAVS